MFAEMLEKSGIKNSTENTQINNNHIRNGKLKCKQHLLDLAYFPVLLLSLHVHMNIQIHTLHTICICK